MRLRIVKNSHNEYYIERFTEDKKWLSKSKVRWVTHTLGFETFSEAEACVYQLYRHDVPDTVIQTYDEVGNVV